MYSPLYRITPYLLNLIDEASALRAGIERASVQVPWLARLQKEARSRSTHSSTSIEGNPLTLSQVEALERGESTGSPRRDEDEVTNHFRVLRWIDHHARQTIDTPAIKKMHGVLMKGLLPGSKCGVYKEKQNYVVNEKGIRIYTPPSPRMTAPLMKELIDWLHSKKSENLHGILISAIVHHRFVSIHPFSDGNGRLARVLGTWVLYQRGFDTRHVLSLDDFFARDRERYYEKIQQARDLDDDLTHWLEYVAEGIVDTLKKVQKRIETLQVASRSSIILSPRQEEVVRLLRDQVPLPVSQLIMRLKVSRARVNQILSPLVQQGIVIQEGKSRATRYRLGP